MKHPKLFQEDIELDELLAKQQELKNRLLVFERNRIELEKNRAEVERTIPPLMEISERQKWLRHEEKVSRGDVANVRRDQNHGLLMLFLLITATCSLVWWGLRLMQNG
jgi:hypothetical protein